MASLLDSYVQQYGNLTSEITHKLGKIPKLTDDERRIEITATARLFEETKELLEQMSLEIQDLPAGVRQKYKNRLDSYKKELDKLETEFKRPRLYDEAALREELLGGGVTEDQRAQLLTNTERLERTGNRLEDGYRVILETEEIGTGILSDLGHQRETLQKSRERLRETNDDLGKSSRILSGMLRRVLQNRILLIVIVFVMLVVIGVTVYFVAKPKKS